ncbi:MAG: ATP phosphoribosyltransferase regulatory subunit [Lachnospiraceae bacterium]|nr:ATP phosphoribosyltransferase regulatory subunit [Lachnospiraceae bacterium]
MKQLLHTPEGVRDIYNSECNRKTEVENRLRRVFKRYGYFDIQTPSFEFFDIFSKERGSVAGREMYKFFDREGNTLVLRPDMTPPIARCASKYYGEETCPVRLSYIANTYINHSSYQGRLKERTQAGAECIGDDTSDADAEVIALVIACLKTCGLTEFQVDIGQVGFFKGLVEEAGFGEETAGELKDLIEKKNFFGVEERILKRKLPGRLSEAFLKLPQMFGGIECVREAKKLTENPTARAALMRLENLYQLLTCYGLEQYVSFDLGMLGTYRYYTGIIFRAFTYGTGEALGSGGRYDRLMCQFGKDAPSVGFGLYVDNILSALSRQNIPVDTDTVDTLLLYEKDCRQTAIRTAEKLRGEGENLQLLRKRSVKTLEEYRVYAENNQIRRIYYLDGEGLHEVE